MTEIPINRGPAPSKRTKLPGRYAYCREAGCFDIGNWGVKKRDWKHIRYYCRPHAMKVVKESANLLMLIPPYVPPPVTPIDQGPRRA